MKWTLAYPSNSLFPYLHSMKKFNVFSRVLLLVGLQLTFLTVFGQQDRKSLEAQRKTLEGQIKSTSEILQKTQKSKTKSLSELKALNAQIRQRQELLNSINSELKVLDKETAEQVRSRTEAEKTIQQLEYRLTHALRSAYVRAALQPGWMYVLSAQSLSMALSRWVYLRQYKSYVMQQMKSLSDKKKKHQELIHQLEINRKEKVVLFSEEEKNKKAIQVEQKEQQSLVNDLSRKEKKLKSDLATSEEKKKKLDSEIARLIRVESNKMNTSGLTSAPETKALNDQFSANKGKLPWPVRKGLITDRFGEHPHPVLKGIKVQNNGIDIKAESGAEVKSLFNGTVASVTKIPGYDYMVMVRHGLYFTVYSKIIKPMVKKGDTITTGQLLGYLSQEEPELHLEIWQDKMKLDPQVWLSK